MSIKEKNSFIGIKEQKLKAVICYLQSLSKAKRKC